MIYKTISALNEHFWYRLLKVIFIGVFTLAIIILLLIVCTTNQQQVFVDSSKTTVDCHYPTEHTITADEGNLYFTINDFPNGSYSSYYMNQEIQDACGMNSQDVANYLKTAVDNGAFMTINDKGQKSYAIFNVHPVFIKQGGWLIILIYSCLSLVLMIALAEGIRRVFYYVALGSFKPKKF